MMNKRGFIDLDDINWTMFALLAGGGLFALWMGFKIASGMGEDGSGAYSLVTKLIISVVVVVASLIFSRE